MILKRKSRYILVECSAPLDLGDKRLWDELRGCIAKFIGEKDYADSNLTFIKQTDPTKFLLRTSRGAEKKIVLALSFVKQINSKEAGFYTLRTSGTIRSLRSQQTST
ncbi:MAG: Rpp14/Pop5 family protein [Candidatus Micrarchaeota archaeon]|nr:Rpp14/Pop5 family protein [Candidatus Micrarchaeota archaeon]